MSRINCHSAFRHYEMFHGHGACCGGNSYGSVFNTTYNIKCGGHGGFWGGFGLGLGSFFGNILGGFMGNMGIGGFGGGMGFGFQGFGFPSFGSGNWFGGGNSNRTNDSNSSKTNSCNCKCNDNITKKNEDYAKLNKLFERKNNLLAEKTPDLEDLKTLKSDIEALEDNLDGNDDTNDKNYIEQLKKGLDEKISELESTTTSAPAAPATPATPSTPAAVAPPADPAAPASTVKDDKADTISGATNMDDLLDALPDGDYSKLSPSDKAAFDKKFGDLLKGMSEDDRLALLNNPKLPAALRAKVKQSFYKAGYTNYDGQTELKDGDVILAHDESGNTRDTKQAAGKTVSTITKSTTGKHPQTIVIHDKKDITYTYKETIDGEYIYTSDQDNQEYVLQKNNSGKYDLMQYRYHKGFGTRDWS